ncbi:MAG TPA: B12-binding domain-containing radical SAM protein [Soehngenia sp.]|nr:B12-binding domain-containing radical SAM protein [Soehngenia sp.]HPP31905.1 B12-binding domain-containing radical SAM protein [Soehngenia sp.]
MSILLTTLNSKFIHTNLAIRYLKKYVEDITKVDIIEFTINQTTEEIARKIFILNPDMVGFSTYIWNLEQTLDVCKRLKIVNPNIKILLGGPEVSFDSKQLLEANAFIDYIICEEGEETFKELLLGLNPYKIEGLVFRDEEKIIENKRRKPIENLDSIPSPYIGSEEDFSGKIVYYEASRGCPFTCDFCLSSGKKVRFFSVERVLEDIDYLVKKDVKQIKFVDRTFNANKKFAKDIIDHIIELNPEDINFHFELTARLLDFEQIEYLKKVKEGLFQFEIGVQSTNKKTLKEISRNEDYEKVKNVSLLIKEAGNIHQHLDLIIGLPYEDYMTFSKSFDDLYYMQPDKLQLGFLKLLKGSKLRLNEKMHGYVYLDKPPYEILYNNYISYSDIVKLKFIEEVVEKYYNEGYFRNSIDYLVKIEFSRPFEFFEDFSKYLFSVDFFNISHSKKTLYNYLNEYYKHKNFDNYEMLIDIMKFDYLYSKVDNTLPEFMQTTSKIKSNEFHSILKNPKILNKMKYHAPDLPTKEIIKDINICKFHYDILEIIKNPKGVYERDEKIIIFEYNKKGVINKANVLDITKAYEEMCQWN